MSSSSLRANSLSLFEGIAQSIGGIAPSGGIAVIIPLVFAKAGNATWMMFLPMVVGFLLLGAVFRIFARRTASAGGLGGFGELAFGKWGGIVLGWTYIVALLSSVADGAPQAVYYADALIHELSGAPPPLGLDLFLIVATLALAAGIAYRGIKLSTDLMLWIECLSLGAMILLVACALVREPHWIDAAQFHARDLRGDSIPLAVVVAFLSLGGFESVTTLGEEARHATQTIPRVILCCVAPMSLLYIAMAYCLVLIFHHSPVPLDQTEAPFEIVAHAVGLPWLGLVVSVGVFLSFFAMVLGCLNAGARALYDLAKKSDFWPRFGRVQPRYASPASAIFLLAAVGLAIPLLVMATGTSLGDCIAYLTQWSSLAFIGAYVLICIAAPVYLYRIKALDFSSVAVSVASLLILCAIGSLNVYPVPPWPWNILPYASAALVATGIGATLLYQATRKQRR